MGDVQGAGAEHQLSAMMLTGLGAAKHHLAGELERSHMGVQGLRDEPIPITHPSSSITKLIHLIQLAPEFIRSAF